MRKIALSLLLLCLAASLSLAAVPKSSPDTFASLGHVTASDGGVCTAFSIDDQRRLFLTAAHCDAPEVRVDDTTATVVFRNTDADLMVLFVPGDSRPPLHPATARTGDAITAYGHAYGWPVPQARKGAVALADVTIAGAPGLWLVTDFALVGGMSGGPIVDAQGRVIGMTQRGNSESGLARPVRDVLALTASYWRFAE